MNATVITTGPGVIIATATASRNCCSVNQCSSFTTPPCKKGTIARPEPKTNAPAAAKNQNTCDKTLVEAGPCSPVMSQTGTAPNAVALPSLDERHATMTIPESRNSHTISDSVQAVTMALMANTIQSARSWPSVLPTSF